MFQIKWLFIPKNVSNWMFFGGLENIFFVQTPKFHPAKMPGGGLEFGHCRAAGPNHETRPTKNRRNGPWATVGAAVGSKVTGGWSEGVRGGPKNVLNVSSFFSNMFWNVHPENWGRWSHFDEYFSNGLVQPPTSRSLEGNLPTIMEIQV